MLRIFPYDTEGVEQAIADFEDRFTIKFPEKYKEFLLKYNGGNSLQTSFSINRKTSDIRAFYGFNKANQYNNFQYLIESGFLEEVLDRGFIPIAKDSFGNSILLGVTDKNFNQLAFFDHEGQLVRPLEINFEDWVAKLKSKKKKIRTIEERIADMRAVGSKKEITPGLKEIWQEEIDKYAGREQVIVRL
ncbi:SMI1/KNR4 family protein [Streptococcus cristatus]|uniref:SMI1/KNR4 family protein n=1 Tax=Streptococcus cristatus TaxID=45634 RepID=UPI0011E723F5|nr:SMI1/KNR4 family protein [Streptococcus cristatus]